MTVVTTLRLDDKLHAWAIKRAKANGQTLNGLFRVMLEGLKHDEEQAKRISKIKQLEA